MHNQLKVTKAIFSPIRNVELPKNKDVYFLFGAKNLDYDVNLTFSSYIALVSGSNDLSVHLTIKDYSKYDSNGVCGKIIFETFDISKEQISLILSFENPEQLIQYALSLYSQDKKTPCSAPAVPSDDGDGASFIDDDLPPAYTQSQVGGVQ